MHTWSKSLNDYITENYDEDGESPEVEDPKFICTAPLAECLTLCKDCKC